MLAQLELISECVCASHNLQTKEVYESMYVLRLLFLKYDLSLLEYKMLRKILVKSIITEHLL